ncbi:unnamed protein product [Allacma fusca]|uniref:Uncharacterized protein n=1 Tax=Allacma fusca TaxID=39272 RepID=A0A8J2PRB3_9HEXA|nr:unnamed protein product [Allacma fusca]
MRLHSTKTLTSGIFELFFRLEVHTNYVWSHLSQCLKVNEQVYMGHVYENWDCPGQQFSAVPWGDPVPTQLAASGLDCMRLCLQIKTCFGISVRSQSCYLKNDICFNQNNLVRAPQTIIGVLRIVREDYRCGCHYPFERERMNGSVLEWYPVCPGVTPMNSLSVRYACCSKKGLCEEC